MSSRSHRSSRQRPPVRRQGPPDWVFWAGGAAALLVAAALIIGYFRNTTPASHPAATPSAVAAGQPVDGIPCQAETVTVHYHAHLTLLDDGTSGTVPAGIGISQHAQCLYWLHTHSDDGIIHAEAPARRDFTLGEFFDIWGQPLTATQAGPLSGQLRFYVNGQQFVGDPRTIPIASHALITIESGREVPPPDFSWPNGY